VRTPREQFRERHPAAGTVAEDDAGSACAISRSISVGEPSD